MIADKPLQDIIRIVGSGGGLTFNASAFSTKDLVTIAANASSNSPIVTLQGIGGRPTAELIQIASNGRGRVVFAD